MARSPGEHHHLAMATASAQQAKPTTGNNIYDTTAKGANGIVATEMSIIHAALLQFQQLPASRSNALFTTRCI
jgi:hypothetical protein